MSRMFKCICFLFACCFLSACAAPISSSDASLFQADARVLSEVRMQYQDANLIVSGICSGTHINANGDVCQDLSVETVYAGTAQIGDIIHSTHNGMEIGERYVLFLGEGEDVHYAEDIAGYSLLSDMPLPIIDNEMIWNGKRLSLQDLQNEIKQLSNIISAPAPLYYFEQLDALTNYADEIFIGRVVELPEYQKHVFDIRNGGTTEKVRYHASIVTIEVLGSIKGKLGGRYGMEIRMVHAPEHSKSMLNESALQPVAYAGAPALELEELYLFFLVEGPDSKQPYYFSVNAIQGFAKLDHANLRAHESNAPLRTYGTLKEAIAQIRSILKNSAYNAQDDDAPLLIVEE